ncbi:MAG: carbohydrate ABC transporter permease [Firmicutes bacterium]|nr:carbohydrate ABC transporter permease [Bacillota bacterium]
MQGDRYTRTIVKKAGIHLVLIIGGLTMLFPFLWLVSSSFKPASQIFQVPIQWIPTEITFDNFISGWKGLPGFTFSTFILNSIKVTGTVVIATVFSSSFVAYGFSRIDFKFRNVLFLLLLSTLMIPSQVTLIPLYIIFAKVGLIDTYVPLTIGAFLGGGAFFIFMLRQFYDSIPKDLDDSARIDGCNHFQIYYRIILPLSKPALSSVAVFSFIWTYNDFMTPLIYLNDVKKYTIPVALRMFVDNAGKSNWGGLLAMSLVAMLPAIIVFFSAQRYFIEGIATTGIRG